MSTQYTVPLSKLIKDLTLEVLYTPKEPKDIYITCADC